MHIPWSGTPREARGERASRCGLKQGSPIVSSPDPQGSRSNTRTGNAPDIPGPWTFPPWEPPRCQRRPPTVSRPLRAAVLLCIHLGNCRLAHLALRQPPLHTIPSVGFVAHCGPALQGGPRPGGWSERPPETMPDRRAHQSRRRGWLPAVHRASSGTVDPCLSASRLAFSWGRRWATRRARRSNGAAGGPRRAQLTLELCVPQGRVRTCQA